MHDQVEALKANGIPAEALNSGKDVTDELIIRQQMRGGRSETALCLTRETPQRDTLSLQQHQDFALSP